MQVPEMSMVSMVLPLMLLAAPNRWCAPESAVAAILAEEGRQGRSCGYSDECVSRRLETIERGLASHPTDVHLHRRRLDMLRWRGPEASAPALAEYRALLAAHPADPVALYTGGLAKRREGDDAGAAALFEQALAADPTFPWPHLDLSYGRRGQIPADVVRAHVNAFRSACPDSSAVYETALHMGDNTLVSECAARLRPRLEQDSTGDDVGMWQLLWQAEFQVTPVAQHSELRRKVAGDLVRLRANTSADGDYWETLIDGYTIIGDSGRQRQAEDEWAQREPCDRRVIRMRSERDEKAAPKPDSEADEATLVAHAKARFAQASARLEACPADGGARVEQLFNITDDVPNDRLLSIFDAFLAAWEGPDGLVLAPMPPQFVIARLYLERNVRVDAVLPLARAALREAERHAAAAIEHGQHRGDPATAIAVQDLALASRRFLAHQLTARAEARLGHARDADAALAAMAADLKAVRGDDARARAIRADRTKRLWQTHVEVDKALGRPFEEAAARLAEANAGPAPPAPDEWKPVNRPLPGFDLIDLGGRHWTLAGLKGRTAVIYLWARWCGASLFAMPDVVRLSERLRQRKDVILLSLNGDQDVGPVAGFARDHGVTFPVLLAYEWLDANVPNLYYPQTWIVDPTGTVRFEGSDFGGSGIDGVLAKVDLARQAASASPPH